MVLFSEWKPCFSSFALKKCGRNIHSQENFWVPYDRQFIGKLFEKYELHNVSIIKNTAKWNNNSPQGISLGRVRYVLFIK